MGLPERVFRWFDISFIPQSLRMFQVLNLNAKLKKTLGSWSKCVRSSRIDLK